MAFGTVAPEAILGVLLLPAAFLLGLVTSYEDFKQGRIRNIWVAGAIGYALAVMAGYALFLISQGFALNAMYFAEYGQNLLFSLFVGVLFWHGGLWSSGDAKLFLAYAALVPVHVYEWGRVGSFPSFAILVNTFVPFFLFLFLRALFRTSASEKLSVLKSVLQPKMVLSVALFVFAFMWPVELALGFLGVKPDIFAITALTFLLLISVRKMVPMSYVHIALPMALARLVFDKGVFTIAFLQNFAMGMAFFFFFAFFAIQLGSRAFSTPVYVERLRPGMLLAENLVKAGNKYRKVDLAQISFIQGLMERSERKELIQQTSDGLSERDVRKLKALHSSGKFEEHTVRVYQTVPFAPFNFAGVIVTVAVGGNMIAWLASML